MLAINKTCVIDVIGLFKTVPVKSFRMFLFDFLIFTTQFLFSIFYLLYYYYKTVTTIQRLMFTGTTITYLITANYTTLIV